MQEEGKGLELFYHKKIKIEGIVFRLRINEPEWLLRSRKKLENFKQSDVNIKATTHSDFGNVITANAKLE